MKKTIIIFFCFLLSLALPIYGAGRIMLPVFLKDKLIENLPADAKLDIGDIKSKSNLSILYQDVSFTNGNVSFNFEQALIIPRLSISNPIIIEIPKLRIESFDNLIILNNLFIKVFPKGQSKKDLTFGGEIKSLTSEELFVAKDVEFLITEFGNAQPKVEVLSEEMHSQYDSPIGKVIFFLSNVKLSLTEGQNLNLSLQGDNIKLDLSNLGYENENRKLYSSNARLSLAIKKQDTWKMPIEMNLENVVSETSDFSEQVTILAVASWEDQSIGCGIQDLIKGITKCGQIVDVTDITVDINDEKGSLKFAGDGYCVAPNSGCPQRIYSRIYSSNTTEIFTNIMSSGLINPLIGGILLGGLLSSPLQETDVYDNEVKIDVLGTQIFMNDEPLIK